MTTSSQRSTRSRFSLHFSRTGRPVRAFSLAAVALFGLGGCGGSVSDVEDRGGPCPAGPVFGTPIMPLEDLDHIIPLGSVNPSTSIGGHTLPTSHTYWNTRAPGVRPVTLFAPADLVIQRINRSESSNPQITEYEVVFAVCDEMEGSFAHMSGLASELAASLRDPNRCETTNFGAFTRTECEYAVGRRVHEGDVLGSASQFQFQRGIDFGLRDSRRTLDFANPTRWLDWVTHTVCPVDYYEPTLRARLEAVLGALGTRRTVPPLCGRIDFDVAGTAQGIWFLSGVTAFDQGVVSLVTDNVLPEVLVFSIGAVGTSSDGQALYFSDASTGRVRRHFDQVTADGAVWCYDELNRVRTLTPPNVRTDLIVLLQLRSDGRLQIESRSEPSCGSGPWAFSSSAVTLER